MPRKPRQPCRHPGCPRLSDRVYCPERRALYARESAAGRGYTGKWQRARTTFLKKHPLCAYCLAQSRLTPATVVDHVIPHRGDPALFWDEANWQPLCKPCHDQKTGSGL